MRQIDQMNDQDRDTLRLKGMLPEQRDTANQITLAEVNKLEKRVGARIWDGVLFNRDGISNPTLTILDNAIGREIHKVRQIQNEEYDKTLREPKQIDYKAHAQRLAEALKAVLHEYRGVDGAYDEDAPDQREEVIMAREALKDWSAQ
jgi:hypothetical protein